MTHIISKYKSLLLLIFILAFSISILYVFTDTNADKVPERAVLVFESNSSLRSI